MKNIYLRRWTEKDLPFLIQLETDPDVVKHTTVRFPLSKEKIEVRLNNQIQQQQNYDPFGIWLVESSDHQEFIGWCMLLPRNENQIELGYMIKKDLWNKGYTTEIVKNLVQYAKDHSAVTLVAKIDPENSASEKVLQKNKFQFIKTEIKNDLILKKDITLKIYQKDLTMNQHKPTYTLNDNTSLNRFEFNIENHTAYIDYSINADTLSLNKVFVPKELENQGIASALMKASLNAIKDKKQKVIPVCSFAVSYFEKHPEYKDLLK